VSPPGDSDSEHLTDPGQREQSRSMIGIVVGWADRYAQLMLAAGQSLEAIEFRAGKDIMVPTSAELVGGDPLIERNQLLNADFAEGLDPWAPTEPMAGWTTGQNHPGWHLRGGATGYIRQLQPDPVSPMALLYRAGHPDGLIPLRPGANYRLCGLFGAHRCEGNLSVRVLDPGGEVLGTAGRATSPGYAGGEEAEGYETLVVEFTAPSQPCFAQLSIVKGATLSGQDSWLFFSQVMFTRTSSRRQPGFSRSPFEAASLSVLQRLDATGIWTVRLMLPPHDGEVQIVERATNLPLIGSPLHVNDAVRLEGGIDGLDGTVLVGRALDLDAPFAWLEVFLYVDGRLVATATADQPRGDGYNGFRIPLPASTLDGMPHALSVRLKNNQLVGQLVEILPASLTPWDALARYGSVRLPARLSAAAAFRYEALREQIAALAQTSPGTPAADALPATLAQLAVAHERVLGGIDRKSRLAPLVFPVHDKPRVSVVIPVHNKVEVTHNCLAALLLAYNETSFEVIIADDGSSDATRTIGDLVSGIVYCRNETAGGFIDACMLGASRAQGEYLVLLNNDTEPTSRWLDELLHVFDNFDQVGLAGSKLLYPDGRLQEAGGIVWGSGNPWNYGRLANASEPRFSYTRQADYVSGAALMMPMSLWREVGGLSEELRPAYFEDTDLAFKVRKAGYRVVYAAQSVVFHFEGVSNGTSTASGLKRFQEVNRPKFQRKWRAAYRDNGMRETLEQADLEKDRGIAMRALFIDAGTPRPDQDAGSHAAVQEIRAIQALGAKVTFLPENLAFLAGYTTDLQRAGVEMIYAPFATSIEDFLARRGREFDIVYITRYIVADRQLDAVRRHAPQARVMFCNADLHFLRELREAVQSKDPEKMAGALATRDTELKVMRNVDVTLSYNPVEHAVILSHNLDSTRVVQAPWIVDVASDVPGFAARRDVAFLGGFGHPPNAEAVKFFIGQVMPLLRRRVPGLSFLIYGSGVPPEIEKLGGGDVVVKGFVPHVSELFLTCRVFVAPLLTGAGVKGKVVDALSFGVPSVLSPVAAEGIGISEGAEAMVARTPAAWADAVATLYTDQAAWAAMSERALSFARRTYSLARGVEQMRAAVEAVGLVPDTGMVLQRARLGL